MKACVRACGARVCVCIRHKHTKSKYMDKYVYTYIRTYRLVSFCIFRLCMCGFFLAASPGIPTLTKLTTPFDPSSKPCRDP